MAKVKKTKEILITTENKVGMLHEVSSVIAGEGANITAVCACGMGDKARFMIVTDNNAKATEALKAKGYKVEEKAVVEIGLEDRVAALEGITQKIAKAAIDINYIYGTVNESKVPATLILSSNNDDKAIGLLK